METAYLLTLSILLGGMIAFQVLFAPAVFIKLEMPVARRFIRDFFPYYYLYFAVFSAIGAALTLPYQDARTVILSVCLLGFVVARQKLMPMANDASDAGDKTRFNRIHRLTVMLNTAQLVAIVYLVVQVI